jgi:hypothetical protein
MRFSFTVQLRNFQIGQSGLEQDNLVLLALGPEFMTSALLLRRGV